MFEGLESEMVDQAGTVGLGDRQHKVFPSQIAFHKFGDQLQSHSHDVEEQK